MERASALERGNVLGPSWVCARLMIGTYICLLRNMGVWDGECGYCVLLYLSGTFYLNVVVLDCYVLWRVSIAVSGIILIDVKIGTPVLLVK